ncbi:MFS transporter [Acidisphaera sp. L21]|uniref:MFS transporter n=1 Tax=Acidisphaera sp. L21 TaxID=1641851 RepID=UPI00131DC6CE|nr:MFS transporter [Acidisphaera sp. L21]
MSSVIATTAAPVVAAPTVSPMLQRRRWAALTLLVVSGTVNYLDRGTLSVANVLIQKELGVNTGQMGLLLSAFALAYAFSQLPVGLLIDRFGPRRVLSLGVAAWSLAQVVCGFMTSFTQLFIARLALGVCESPQYPTAARVTANWFSQRDRGLPTGVFNTASMIGSALSPLLLTVLMLTYGWRWMFVIMGVAGLLISAVWYLVYRDPELVPLPAADRIYLAQDANPAVRGSALANWGKLFRFPTVWGMLFGQMGLSYINWVYITWLPGYLEIERHLSVKQTGFAASVPFIFGIFGSLFGGVVSDWFAHRGVSPINSRKIPILTGLVCAAICTVSASMSDNVIVCLAFISASMFFSYTAVAGVWSLPSAVAPQNEVATLGSIQNFGGYLGGAMAPAVTGFVAHSTGSFTYALWAGAGIALCSACSVLFVVRRRIMPDAPLPI